MGWGGSGAQRLYRALGFVDEALLLEMYLGMRLSCAGTIVMQENAHRRRRHNDSLYPGSRTWGTQGEVTVLLEALDLSKVKPIRDMAYDIIRRAICDGDLKPGDRLVENELAEKMKISRTPVREALRKLEIEGLIKYVPHKGVLVKGFSKEDIIEIYSIRQALEVLAVRNTIKNITLTEIEELRQILAEMRRLTEEDDTEALCKETKRFNEIMIQSSKMPRVIGLISTYQDYLERFRVVTMKRKERKVVALREHEEILEAIVDRDAAKAEETVRRHLEGALEAYLKTKI